MGFGKYCHRLNRSVEQEWSRLTQPYPPDKASLSQNQIPRPKFNSLLQIHCDPHFVLSDFNIPVYLLVVILFFISTAFCCLAYFFGCCSNAINYFFPLVLTFLSDFSLDYTFYFNHTIILFAIIFRILVAIFLYISKRMITLLKAL